jgi:hypothetical protein
MQSGILDIAMYAGEQFRYGAIEKGISDLAANHDIIAETNGIYCWLHLQGRKPQETRVIAQLDSERHGAKDGATGC